MTQLKPKAAGSSLFSGDMSLGGVYTNAKCLETSTDNHVCYVSDDSGTMKKVELDASDPANTPTVTDFSDTYAPVEIISGPETDSYTLILGKEVQSQTYAYNELYVITTDGVNAGFTFKIGSINSMELVDAWQMSTGNTREIKLVLNVHDGTNSKAVYYALNPVTGCEKPTCFGD